MHLTDKELVEREARSRRVDISILTGNTALCLSSALYWFVCGSRIHGKGVHMYKGVGVRIADFISFFLNIPRK